MYRTPNLFIPGFPKSGTSALHAMLIQHPEIFAPERKEPHTFSHDYYYKRRADYFRQNLMNLESRYILDSSTAYMVSPRALERIVDEINEPKFIIIARDPVARIVSHYNWLSKKGFVDQPFKEEMKLHLKERYDYRVHYQGNAKAYLDCSLYGEKIQFLKSLVSNDQIYFTTQEAFQNDWHSVISEILAFLRIDDFTFKNKRVNETSKIEQRITKMNLVEKVIRRLKKELMILNGFPRTQKVSHPKDYQITLSEDVYALLLPHLQKDINLIERMGYDISEWNSYKLIN